MIGFVFRSETDSDKERPHPYLCFGGGESDDSDSEERHQLLEVRLPPLRALRREQHSERRHQGCGGLLLQLHKDSDGDTLQLLLIIKSESII